MKEFETGMVLGKFYPPHNGHLHLINTAISKCDIVYVLCCSIESETMIDGFLRWSWLYKIYASNKNVRVIHVTDENPQYPEEHEQFWAIWHKTVYDNIPTPLDVIFTSEEYGDPFAKVLGCKHYLVDLPRETVPVSGTAVRENAFQNWDYIPEVVRGHFTKKVVVVGPESTGKSTLTEDLAKFFDGELVKEYGREYTEKMDNILDLAPVDFDRIAFGHMLDVLKVNDNPKRLRFVDTEAIQTKVFGKLYLGDNFESGHLEKMIASQKFDLWFLTDIDVPYVNDGNRMSEKHRVKHLELLKAELDKRKIKYVVISGNWEERLENAKKEIFTLLGN